MWLLPFLIPFKAPPVPSFWAEAAAAALGLVALTVWAPWARSLAFPRVAWLPLGFAALLLLQLSLGRVAYYQQAILAVLYLLWACALIILGGTFRRELGLTHVAITLAWFLCAGGVLSAIIGLAQLLESYDLLGRFITVASGNRVWGNLAQANHLADYLSLGLASTAFLYAIGRLRPVYTVFVAGLLVYHTRFDGLSRNLVLSRSDAGIVGRLLCERAQRDESPLWSCSASPRCLHCTSAAAREGVAVRVRFHDHGGAADDLRALRGRASKAVVRGVADVSRSAMAGGGVSAFRSGVLHPQPRPCRCRE